MFDIGSIIFFASNDNDLINMSSNYVFKKNTILFPIFDETDRHFFLIAIDALAKKFIIFDSLKIPKMQKSEKSTFYYNGFRQFLKFIEFYNTFHPDNQFESNLDTIFFPKCYKQIGNDDCGIYTIIHAKLYMNDGYNSISNNLPNVNIKNERLMLQYELLKNSDNMELKCIICGDDILLTENENLLKCKFCERYFHKDEIQSTYYEDFTCVICSTYNNFKQ